MDNFIFPIIFFQYCAIVTKYDRHGYHARQRVIIVTDKSLYMVNEKDFKVKETFPFSCIKGKYFCVTSRQRKGS